jgi:F-type H+-transporting ATPase subunit gamma
MQTLEALARRIGTTEELRSVVRTMKTLSAVSIRQYETAAAAIAEYQRTIELGLQIVLGRHRQAERPPAEPDGPVTVLLFGSDHGLCGRFNDQTVDMAFERLRHDGLDPAACRWLVLGARAEGRLEAAGLAPLACYRLPGSVDGLTDTVATILVQLDALQREHAFGRALMFHNRSIDRTSPVPRLTRLLPLDERYLRALARRPWTSRCLPDFSMEVADLFSALLRQYLFSVVYRAGAESLAAEHATRLLAMQSAERNIAETLDEMNADYRRERQADITSELLDVVAGYRAASARAAEPTR